MNKKIEEFLEQEEKKNGFDKWKNDDELLELLRSYDEVYKEKTSEHRWWNEYQYVIKIGNKYIAYVYAETTGDMNAWEAGYEFDSDSICEMEPIEKTITNYIKKRI